MKEIIIRDDKNWGDLHQSVETQRDYEQQIADQVRNYPGCAREVWGGWVWVIGFSDEQRWSKRPTRHACERVVYEVVERLGIEEAFDLESQS